MQTNMQQVKKLKDKELLAALHSSIQDHNAATAQMLLHVGEVDARRPLWISFVRRCRSVTSQAKTGCFLVRLEQLLERDPRISNKPIETL